MEQVRKLRSGRMAAALLTALVVAAGTGTAAAADEKPIVVSGIGGSDLKMDISGQVNPVAALFDDGVTSGLVIGDNTSNPSRVGFKMRSNGGYDYNYLPNLQVGVNVELGLNPDTLGSYDNQTGDFSSSFDSDVNTRVLETFVRSQEYGLVSLGYGAEAGRYFLQSDVSRTESIQGMDAPRNFGLTQFTDGTGYTGDTIGELFPDVGGGRNGRLAYDTPRRNGVMGMVSYSTEDAMEIMLDWAMGKDVGIYEYMDAYASLIEEMQVRVGFLNNVGKNISGGADLRDDYRIGGSGSVLLTNGVNVTLAYVNREPHDPATSLADSQTYLKVGYIIQNKWAVAFDYGISNDAVDGTRYGLGYTWDVTPNYTAGAFLNRYEEDVSGVNTDPVYTVGFTLAAQFGG